MSKKDRIGTILKNGGLFVLVAIIALKVFIFNDNFQDTVKIMLNTNLTYVFIAILVMGLVVICEATNIKRSLHLFKEETTLLQCIHYSFVGIFFSSITPSATGGQPMQIYYMHKRKINISSGMLALLVCLASYQFVVVLLGGISIIYNWNYFHKISSAFSVLFFIGMVLNSLLLFLIVMAIFSKKAIYSMVNFIVRIIKCFSEKKALSFKERAFAEIERYKESANHLKGQKAFIINTILITMVQIIALHSIPFWAYKSLGLSGATIFQFVLVQAALYIAGAVLPLPGAVGIGEGGFLVFFKAFFPDNITNSAMIISRGISFYLMVIISGIGTWLLDTKKYFDKKKYKRKSYV